MTLPVRRLIIPAILQGNNAFRSQDFETAIKQYTKAFDTEPELPHYQLNIAAAHLKLAKSVTRRLFFPFPDNLISIISHILSHGVL